MSLKDKIKDKADRKQTEAPAGVTPGHAVPLSAHKDGEEAWHLARRKGVGGSDVAIIMGQKPYGTDRVDLWREKTGRQERKVGNAAVRYGSIIEDQIRQWLISRADDTPAVWGEFSDLIDYPVQCRHPEHVWARGNLDGLLVDAGGHAYAGLEIKQSAHAHGSDKLDWRDDGVMSYHYPQIQHYLWVYDLPVWHYVYFEAPADREFTRLVADEHAEDVGAFWQWVIDQGTMTTRKVARDDEYIATMVAAERGFWSHVEHDTEPDLWLPDGEVEVEDDDLADLLDRYGYAHAKGDDARKDELKPAIKERAQYLAAKYEAANGTPPKKLHVAGTDDYATWNSRGYWMAKPAERDPNGSPESEGQSDYSDLPF